MRPFEGVRAGVTRPVVRLDLGDADRDRAPSVACRSTAPSSRGRDVEDGAGQRAQASQARWSATARAELGELLGDPDRRGAAAGVAGGDRALDGEHVADAGVRCS